MNEIQEIKDIFVVWTNTDLTEGRGYEYVQYCCEIEATAQRLAKKNYVQGSDSRYNKTKAFKINNTWHYPSTRLVPPNSEDQRKEKQLAEARILEEKKKAILDKAKNLGLSQEEINLLQGEQK